MWFASRLSRLKHGSPILLLALSPALAASQGAPSGAPGADSVEIAAGAHYEAGGLHRFFLGDGHRDLWATPIRVEVLDLRAFAGGLRPLKLGGGLQTKTLRLVNPRGVQYVFRSVDKEHEWSPPPRFKGTVVEDISRDQVSSSFPAGALVAAPILEAAGVLHVTPTLVVMPDDALLGEFREDFAGRLGMIEEFPSTPKHGAGFAGAVEIIDSDELLVLIDRDPSQRVNARALLAARLMDMLFGDWDRHPSQWKWARMRSRPTTTWLPIPRDRDKAFISNGGFLAGLARPAFPNLAVFGSSYPSVRALTWNSLEFDRRLLGGLEKPAWDSVASALVGRVTDAVIDDAVRALPPEYRQSAPSLAHTLKLRRDGLPGAADRFYRFLAAVADIHATDAADRAIVTRVDDRYVEVRLESGAGTPFFLRRFDLQETAEIRLYLHGGNDTALVTGNVQHSIPVRIIGGNGANRLVDSSLVRGSHDRTRLYDVGSMNGVEYGPDTLFNRRPWVEEKGELVAPGPDRGGRLGPTMSLTVENDLGVSLRLGMNKDTYGFRRRPYASRVGFEAEYAIGFDGFRIGLVADHRRESSPLHFMAKASMSQLEVINYHGLGNATPDSFLDFFEVRQQQWLLDVAVALALGPRSDLSLGPVVQFSTTDSTPDRYISDTQPYGSGDFGQAGLRLVLHHDVRDEPGNPRRGFVVDFTGSVFPAAWDATSAFGGIAAGAAAYLTLPIPVRPILALRGGTEQVFGEFPFHEAAFIGGNSSVRTLDPQRYAGDASLAGTAELRIPLANFPFVLPLDVGVFGFVDAGRVYVDGDSPDGWHTDAGGGFWLGILDPSTAISVTLTTRAGETVALIRTGMTF